MSGQQHTHLGLIAVVALGGMVGTAGRYALDHVLASDGAVSTATLVENLAGAFVLGLLLEALVRAGGENRLRRVLRLGLGTGVLGGFTTYSSLALEVQNMFADGHATAALTYGLGSVVAGCFACTLGVLLSALIGGRRQRLIPRRPDNAAVDSATGQPIEVRR